MRELIKSVLRRLGYVIASSDNIALGYVAHPPATVFLSTLLRLYPSLRGLSFVQVGANDGVRADPIHGLLTRYGWAGVLLEPVPRYFRQLEEQHSGNPRLRLMRAALDLKSGKRPIFNLSESVSSQVPDWAWGLASLDRNRVAQAARELGLPDSAIEQEDVDTTTWDEVWARLPSAACDLVVVDAEGYDITLLRAADLPRRRPRIVHFEHACATMDERMKFYRELLEMGYEYGTDGPDTTAWLRS